VSALEQGRLMDRLTIAAELGVSRAQADAVIRWCNEHRGRVVRPADGARKLFVYREDVEAWLVESTRSAA
jgi:hypothetical protein